MRGFKESENMGELKDEFPVRPQDCWSSHATENELKTGADDQKVNISN